MSSTPLMRRGISFGPLTSTLLFPFPWKDDYPVRQEWADELERLLAFADSQVQIRTFLPRIRTDRANQRDEALNELRVATLLHTHGFPIVAWGPAGSGTMVGEYLVSGPERLNVFVEVKSRGWESELSREERLAGRTKLPKYIDGEGRSFANWRGIRECIASPKTYPKFSTTQPNLLVIADDFFVGLNESETEIDIALYSCQSGYGNETGYFSSPAYRNLGGMAVFAAFLGGKGVVEYKFRVYENPYAPPETKLTKSILALRI